MDFPSRWRPSDPDLIQLYTMPTPNGQKAGIALEELGLPYEAHRIDISAGDQKDPEYLKLNPNGKIPVIVDPHGPDDEPLVLMESIVILSYLADKAGRLLPTNYRARLEHQQWLAFQAAHIGPMFGQFGHFFKFARDKTSDTYPLQRYTDESRRLLSILEQRLAERAYLMGDFSIVDIATGPWVDALDRSYEASEQLGLAEFEHVQAWRDRLIARPAWQRGSKVGAAPAS